MKFNKYLVALLLLIFSLDSFAADPRYLTNTNNACYKDRDIFYPLESVFEALKHTLMQASLNIATVTKEDGVILAKGSQYNEDEETVTSITVTLSFKEMQENVTHVKAIASYETQEKTSDTGQLGAAGISLPIPVPFTGKYVLAGSGNIDDSAWFQGFFNSLEKILFENYMKEYDSAKFMSK